MKQGSFGSQSPHNCLKKLMQSASFTISVILERWLITWRKLLTKMFKVYFCIYEHWKKNTWSHTCTRSIIPTSKNIKECITSDDNEAPILGKSTLKRMQIHISSDLTSFSYNWLHYLLVLPQLYSLNFFTGVNNRVTSYRAIWCRKLVLHGNSASEIDSRQGWVEGRWQQVKDDAKQTILAIYKMQFRNILSIIVTNS